MSFKCCSSNSGSIDSRVEETSMKWGTAPQCEIALAVATKVNEGQITSSFGLTPARCKQTCRAEVPLTVATACRQPVTAANCSSNRVTKAPAEETQPVSRHSFT